MCRALSGGPQACGIHNGYTEEKKVLVGIIIAAMSASGMPYVATGSEPVAIPHFPSRLHAYVWRNWLLAPADRLAEVVDAEPADIVALGHGMGLSGPPEISPDRFGYSYISIIRANWHLLPDEQLLALLDWPPERLAFSLREDDFLYGKMGVRPTLPRLVFNASEPEAKQGEGVMAAVIKSRFPNGVGLPDESLFAFVDRLSEPVTDWQPAAPSRFAPRFSYSYFAVYGDVLLDADPFPDGMLARLAEVGVDGVWLQAVMYKLAPFPWDPSYSEGHEKRLVNLHQLVERASKYGIGVYLYLNEPRSMPVGFFEGRERLKGVEEAGYARLCTSVPEVQDYLRASVALICRAVPKLAGFFTITIGENRTLCWSHLDASGCPRCAERRPEDVVAEACTLIQEGINEARSGASLIVWDWVWPEEWFDGIVARLPDNAALMSVSEWGLPIDRGGGPVNVAEYSMSAVGPGPRAKRHWAIARARGLKTMAKIQASTTWELSTVPYIPAFRNVAEHVARLRDEEVNGLMLSWTVGAYPSAGYEIVSVMGGVDNPSPVEAMLRVARRRFGEEAAPAVVEAWNAYSEALKEYPFHNHPLYLGPVQMGPANLLWERSTGYRATMVGFPYDDLTRWRAMYPVEAFAAQYTMMADGFDRATAALKESASALPLSPAHENALAEQRRVARACAVHFKSTANQARFIQLRRDLEEACRNVYDEKIDVPDEAAFPRFADTDALLILDKMEAILRNELELAIELHAIQCQDSRIGFEASNQYHYTPMDLAEKVLNMEDLLTRWLPNERRKNLYAPNWWQPPSQVAGEE
jgi:hypothetical protein